MAKVLRPIVRSGGFYPSRKYTPLVYPGGYTTLNAKNGKPDPLNTISGSIVRFISNHVKPFVKTVVNIDPVQDLHGYDNPWPAGGGKNIFNVDDANWKDGYLLDSSGAETENSAYRYTQNYVDVLPSTIYAGQANKTSNVGTGCTVCEYDENKVFITRTTLYSGASSSGIKSGTITTTATTKYIRFSLGIATTDIMFEVGSTVSAYAPYSNICPISWWTGANVTGTGKNIWGGTALRDGILNAMSSAVDYPDERHVNFSSAYSATKPFSDGIKFKENTQYTFIFTLYKSSGVGSNIAIMYTNGTNDKLEVSAAQTKETVVFVSDAGKTIKWVQKSTQSGTTLVYYDESGIFEGVLTAADFVPYQGTTLPITFPDAAGTVYGGTLTVNEDGTGKLTVDHAEVDLGTRNWTTGSSGRHSCQIPSGIKTAPNTSAFNGVCSQYRVVPGNSVANENVVLGMINVSFLQVNDSSLNGTDAATFKAAMSGVQLVYELANPIEYTLTAEQVGGILTTLKGENNVWADTGDIEVTVYGVPIVEPQADTLTSLNILLGGAYRNSHTSEDVSDEEALNILLGGADR